MDRRFRDECRFRIADLGMTADFTDKITEKKDKKDLMDRASKKVNDLKPSANS